MKKLLVLLFIVVLIAPAVLFAGGKKDTDDGEIVIGMTVPGLQFPFFVTMAEEAEAAAKDLGMKLIVHDAQNQSATQMSGMENFIAQKVDGILISPMTTDSLVPAIEAAVAAGIPVATVDRKSNSNLVLIHVGADNVEGGRSAARFIIEKLGGKGNVIELEGTPGSSAAIDRKAGFDEIMNESNVKIIVSQTAEFSRSEGQSVMEDLIVANPNFDAVFGANDEMIIGAIEAMSAAGIDLGDMITVGFDATTDAFAYMKDGKLSATVDQFPGRQAGQALQVLYDFITEGKKPANSVVYIKPLPVSD